MDFDRWYRRTQKKAEAQFVQGLVVAIVAAVLAGMLANISKDAGSQIQPMFEVFAWAPRVLAVVGVALTGNATWTYWRLHHDPMALYEDR